jgi:glycosyltransferase involved in cell wall biosynthesis
VGPDLLRGPLVTVVMPAYNAAAFIERAIESVLKQTYDHLELIVVDDGSTDGTATLIESFGGRLVCLRQRNAQQAVARNRGALRGRGELVAFIDADDEWLPQKLERQVRFLDRHAQYSLAICGVQEIDGSGNPLRDRRASFRGDPREAILLGDTGGGICGSTPLIRRREFEQLGGFDEALPPCEDTDLLWRAACSGGIGVIEEVLVRYRLHGGNAHARLDLMIPAWQRFYRKALGSPAARERGWVFRARCRERLYWMLAGDCAAAGAYFASLSYAAVAACQWPPSSLRRLRRLARSSSD